MPASLLPGMLASGETVSASALGSLIIDTSKYVLNNTLGDISKKLLPTLDVLGFVDGAIFSNENFCALFDNIILFANSILVAYVLYYCVRLILSHYSGAEIESPARFFIRVIVAATAMNFSKEICQLIITCSSSISSFFLTLTSEEPLTFRALAELLENRNASWDPLNGIVGLIVNTLYFNLALLFGTRHLLVRLIVLVSPFAFLCFSNTSLEGFYKSWFRMFISLLLVQMLNSLLLLLIFGVVNGEDLLTDEILILSILTAFTKTNDIIKEFLNGAGISSNFNSGVQGLKSMVSR